MSDLKHPSRRQNRSSRTATGRKPTLAALPPKRRPVPDPPAGLLAATRADWTAFWESDLAAQATAPTDLLSVARLFELYDERARCWRGFKRNRLVLGSQNQPVLNPLAKMVTALDAAILAREDRLGLTPLARMRLGVAFADAAKSLDGLVDALDDDADQGDDPRRMQAARPRG